MGEPEGGLGGELKGGGLGGELKGLWMRPFVRTYKNFLL